MNYSLNRTSETCSTAIIFRKFYLHILNLGCKHFNDHNFSQDLYCYKNKVSIRLEKGRFNLGIFYK